MKLNRVYSVIQNTSTGASVFMNFLTNAHTSAQHFGSKKNLQKKKKLTCNLRSYIHIVDNTV